MSVLLTAFGFGLVTAGIVALAAVALSLQIGVTNVPNFAHGELLTFGAYGAVLAQTFTQNLFLDALVGIGVAGIMAWAMNYLVLRSFIRIGTRRIYLLVVTAGISLILQNTLVVVFTSASLPIKLPDDSSYGYRVGPFIWTRLDIWAMASAVAAMVLLYLLLKYTRFGKAQRAVAELPELALVSGVPVTRIVSLTWLIVGLLAGLAGVTVAATIGTVQPTMGANFLLIVFAAVILGGIGKPEGALVAAIIIGIATEVSVVYMNPAYKQVVAVAVLVVAILVRPNGLFTSEREAATWTAIHMGTDR